MIENSKPLFISLVGYPAAGKSTYAMTLKNRGIQVISGDIIRREFMEKYGLESMDAATKSYRKEIIAEMRCRIEDAMTKGIDIVVDAFNTNVDRRSFDLALAKKHGYTCEAHIVYPPEEEEHAKRLVERVLMSRESNTADGWFLHLIESQYQKPSVDEGFDAIIEIGSPPKQPFMSM